MVDTSLSRNKGYSQVEEEFMEASIKLADKMKYNNAEMGRMLGPILGRTKRAIEQKLGFVRQRMEEEGKLHQPINASKESLKHVEKETSEGIYFPRARAQSQTQTKPAIQGAQIIHNESLMDESVPFTEKDVGRVVEVEVVSIQDFGAFCRSDEGKMGLLLKGLLTNDFVTDIRAYLQIGDRFKVLIIKDKREKEKTLLNAKAIGNIIPIEERRMM